MYRSYHTLLLCKCHCLFCGLRDAGSLQCEISTTSHPSFWLSLSICTFSPVFSKISTMLTAMITGIPSSMICVER